MKKLLSILLVVCVAVTMSVSVFAANFVDSIEAKSAPEIIPIAFNGKLYAALIIDKATGTVIAGVPLYKDDGSTSLEFYIISTAEKDKAVLPEIKTELINAEKQIKNAANVGKLDAGLDKEIQKVIDDFYGNSPDKITIDDLVISDVFDTSLIRDKTQIEYLEDGQKIRFRIKPNFTKDDFFVLLHNTNGTDWSVVTDVKWTDDGYLEITVDSLGVFAFAVEKNIDLPVKPNDKGSPQTNNQESFNFLYVGIAVVCVGGAVFFFVKANRRRKAK